MCVCVCVCVCVWFFLNGGFLLSVEPWFYKIPEFDDYMSLCFFD